MWGLPGDSESGKNPIMPKEVFFALSFDGGFPQGNVTFHEGFKANGQDRQ
jgi:hypothetical protein